MDLQDYRNQLDQIDDQLAALFKQRMETVRNVADYKKEHNAPVLNAGRERDILYRVTGECGEELQEYTKILFSTLLELSRDYQENRLNTGESALCREILAAAASSGQFPSRAVVACQGAEGAYSQMACTKMFALPQIMYFGRFDGVFRAVEAGMCRYGILPIENSSAGSVTAPRHRGGNTTHHQFRPSPAPMTARRARYFPAGRVKPSYSRVGNTVSSSSPLYATRPSTPSGTSFFAFSWK